MMGDLVEHLRSAAKNGPGLSCEQLNETADEIERLRESFDRKEKAVQRHRKKIKRLQTKLDKIADFRERLLTMDTQLIFYRYGSPTIGDTLNYAAENLLAILEDDDE